MNMDNLHLSHDSFSRQQQQPQQLLLQQLPAVAKLGCFAVAALSGAAQLGRQAGNMGPGESPGCDLLLASQFLVLGQQQSVDSELC